MPYRTAARIEEVLQSPLEIKALELAERWRKMVKDYSNDDPKKYFHFRDPYSVEDLPHQIETKSTEKAKELFTEIGFNKIYHCHFEDYKRCGERQYVENCCTYLQQGDTLVLFRRLAFPDPIDGEPKDLHSHHKYGMCDFMYVCQDADDIIDAVKGMRWNPKRHFHYSVNFLAGFFLGQYGENHYRGHMVECMRERALKMHPADILMTVVRNAQGEQNAI